MHLFNNIQYKSFFIGIFVSKIYVITRTKCNNTLCVCVTGDCSGNMHHSVSNERGPLLRDCLSSAVTATPNPTHGSGHLCVDLDRYDTNTPRVHDLIHTHCGDLLPFDNPPCDGRVIEVLWLKKTWSRLCWLCWCDKNKPWNNEWIHIKPAILSAIYWDYCLVIIHQECCFLNKPIDTENEKKFFELVVAQISPFASYYFGFFGLTVM